MIVIERSPQLHDVSHDVSRDVLHDVSHDVSLTVSHDVSCDVIHNALRRFCTISLTVPYIMSHTIHYSTSYAMF